MQISEKGGTIIIQGDLNTSPNKQIQTEENQEETIVQQQPSESIVENGANYNFTDTSAIHTLRESSQQPIQQSQTTTQDIIMNVSSQNQPKTNQSPFKSTTTQEGETIGYTQTQNVKYTNHDNSQQAAANNPPMLRRTKKGVRGGGHIMEKEMTETQTSFDSITNNLNSMQLPQNTCYLDNSAFQIETSGEQTIKRATHLNNLSRIYLVKSQNEKRRMRERQWSRSIKIPTAAQNSTKNHSTTPFQPNLQLMPLDPKTKPSLYKQFRQDSHSRSPMALKQQINQSCSPLKDSKTSHSKMNFSQQTTEVQGPFLEEIQQDYLLPVASMVSKETQSGLSLKQKVKDYKLRQINAQNSDNKFDKFEGIQPQNRKLYSSQEERNFVKAYKDIQELFDKKEQGRQQQQILAERRGNSSPINYARQIQDAGLKQKYEQELLADKRIEEQKAQTSKFLQLEGKNQRSFVNNKQYLRIPQSQQTLNETSSILCDLEKLRAHDQKLGILTHIDLLGDSSIKPAFQSMDARNFTPQELQQPLLTTDQLLLEESGTIKTPKKQKSEIQGPKEQPTNLNLKQSPKALINMAKIDFAVDNYANESEDRTEDQQRYYARLRNHLKSDEKIKMVHQRSLEAKDRRYASLTGDSQNLDTFDGKGLDQNLVNFPHAPSQDYSPKSKGKLKMKTLTRQGKYQRQIASSACGSFQQKHKITLQIPTDTLLLSKNERIKTNNANLNSSLTPQISDFQQIIELQPNKNLRNETYFQSLKQSHQMLSKSIAFSCKEMKKQNEQLRQIRQKAMDQNNQLSSITSDKQQKQNLKYLHHELMSDYGNSQKIQLHQSDNQGPHQMKFQTPTQKRSTFSNSQQNFSPLQNEQLANHSQIRKEQNDPKSGNQELDLLKTDPLIAIPRIKQQIRINSYDEQQKGNRHSSFSHKKQQNSRQQFFSLKKSNDIQRDLARYVGGNPNMSKQNSPYRRDYQGMQCSTENQIGSSLSKNVSKLQEDMTKAKSSTDHRKYFTNFERFLTNSSNVLHTRLPLRRSIIHQHTSYTKTVQTTPQCCSGTLKFQSENAFQTNLTSSTMGHVSQNDAKIPLQNNQKPQVQLPLNSPSIDLDRLLQTRSVVGRRQNEHLLLNQTQTSSSMMQMTPPITSIQNHSSNSALTKQILSRQYFQQYAKSFSLVDSKEQQKNSQEVASDYQKLIKEFAWQPNASQESIIDDGVGGIASQHQRINDNITRPIFTVLIDNNNSNSDSPASQKNRHGHLHLDRRRRRRRSDDSSEKQSTQNLQHSSRRGKIPYKNQKKSPLRQTVRMSRDSKKSGNKFKQNREDTFSSASSGNPKISTIGDSVEQTLVGFNLTKMRDSKDSAGWIQNQKRVQTPELQFSEQNENTKGEERIQQVQTMLNSTQNNVSLGRKNKKHVVQEKLRHKKNLTKDGQNNTTVGEPPQLNKANQNELCLAGIQMRPNLYRRQQILSGINPGVAIKNLDYMLELDAQLEANASLNLSQNDSFEKNDSSYFEKNHDIDTFGDALENGSQESEKFKNFDEEQRLRKISHIFSKIGEQDQVNSQQHEYDHQLKNHRQLISQKADYNAFKKGGRKRNKNGSFNSSYFGKEDLPYNENLHNSEKRSPPQGYQTIKGIGCVENRHFSTNDRNNISFNQNNSASSTIRSVIRRSQGGLKQQNMNQVDQSKRSSSFLKMNSKLMSASRMIDLQSREISPSDLQQQAFQSVPSPSIVGTQVCSPDALLSIKGPHRFSQNQSQNRNGKLKVRQVVSSLHMIADKDRQTSLRQQTILLGADSFNQTGKEGNKKDGLMHNQWQSVPIKNQQSWTGATTICNHS